MKQNKKETAFECTSGYDYNAWLAITMDYNLYEKSPEEPIQDLQETTYDIMDGMYLVENYV